jgi:AraC-like DNA-binding protein
LLEAKRLLVNAEFTVRQIAVNLGFKDASYFVRFFKKYEQETPEKFRKKII